MRARCRNPRLREYPLYGGRGITVCDRWARSFPAFLADMGPRPAGTTLDRKDNDGNYEPGNCRWGTRTEQSRNQRSNKLNVEKAAAIRAACDRRGARDGRVTALAAQYDVDHSLISHIIAGRCWKVPPPDNDAMTKRSR